MNRIWIFILFFFFHSTLFAATTSTDDSSRSIQFIDVFSWQLREGGADNWAQIFNLDGTNTPVTVVDAPFQWNTGLRIGIGRLFEPSHNDVVLAYTTYHALATNQASGLVVSSYDGSYFANNTNGAELSGVTYSNASMRWQFYYNIFDLTLGHEFTFGSLFNKLHPYVGLKGGSIKQRIYTNWNNPTPPSDFTAATENLKNDFTGLGPSIGIDSTWSIYSNQKYAFSLIGDLGVALLYGHFSFDDVYKNNTPTPTTITIHLGSVNGASPVTVGLVGFQYMNEFQHSTLKAKIGYQAQMWFNQIQFYSLNGGRFNRSLFLQGINFELQYEI